MSDQAYDGTPTQAGLHPESTDLTGRVPHFSGVGMRLMVVVDVVYIDDPRNRSRRSIEYTCRDLMTGEFATGVRYLTSTGGIDDGEENTLTPATALRPGARSSRFTKQTVARDTNGTVVAVMFVEGSRSQGVILGALAHTSSMIGARRENGERRFIKHKGTTQQFKSDGTYEVRRNNTFIRLNADETIEVVHKSGASIKIDNDGNINAEPSAAGRINLGGGTLADFLDSVVTGRAVDTFSGQSYAVLGGTSSNVRAKP